MDVCVRPRDALLQVAEDSVGLQTEVPSSKLVLLEENPVPKPRGRERLLEFHRDEFALTDSGIRPRVDATPSDGALLSTLGLLFSIPITERLLGLGLGWRLFSTPPKSGRHSSRIEA